VTLADKSACEAQVVAANAGDDLAVLKIEPKDGRPFPYLPLGRSDDLMIGETVIAIGNPLGYQNTCTTGIISALDRKLEFRGGRAYAGLIQTDAPINPGNSGGPLLNMAAGLIGVNTAIRADAQGIGFAIPVDRLTADLPKLLDFERLNRVVFGLTVQQRHLDTTEELVVTAVAPGSPAAKGGCRVGDRLLALNGKNLNQLPDYQFAMLNAAPNAAIKLTCWRNGKTLPLTVTVEPRPKPDGAALAGRLLGLEVRTVTPELARQLRLAARAGMLVTGVEREGPADRLGIRRGDIVFQLGRWYVTDLDRLGAILEDVTAGEALRIGIIRGRARAWTTIRVRRPPVRSSLVRDRVRI
jgi:serine protease Do